MSSNPTVDVKIEGLSKHFQIASRKGGNYRTLRSDLTDAIKSLVTFGRKSAEATDDRDFWALKDVNLEIRRGEKIGLLGHNGAGKSTLLKILSRITSPTQGRVLINGRIASLLEVGTGFHGELTGRENIFLNGALLGMSRAEIHRCFDEIVAFAEIEKFIDTPVKRYSTGMYTRLAFAVAAHLEAEILLIDEVLAVGDVAFQEKCLGRINQLSSSGRTIIFVSHNMTAIGQVCDRGILLEQGKVTADGPINDVIANYLDSTRERTNLSSKFEGKALAPKNIHLSSEGKDVLRIAAPLEVSLELEARRDISFQMAFIISDVMGSELFWLYPFERDFSLNRGKTQRFAFSIEKLNLYPGSYWVGLWLGKGGWMDEYLYDRQIFRVTVTDNKDVRYFPNFKTASVKMFAEFGFKFDPPR